MTLRTLHLVTRPGREDQPMGLQHYEIQLLAALRKIDDPDWRFEVRTVGTLRERRANTRVPMRLLRADPPSPVLSAISRTAYRGIAAMHRFDLRLPPAGLRLPEVVTVHDLPPLRFDDEGDLPAWSRRGARTARCVICPSNFAASEVRSLLGVEHTMVIPNGVDSVYRNAKPFSKDERRSLGLPETYALHVGGATKRKNLQGLAAAWERVEASRDDVSLLLVGPPDARRDAAFTRCRRIRFLGYEIPAQVARLMASSAVVVVPSLYEGFGLPALEAMAAAAPVVAARAGALPEVCGDAALLCEPEPQALADAISAILAEGGLAGHLRRQGPKRAHAFTWQRAAAAHAKTYSSALK